MLFALAHAPISLSLGLPILPSVAAYGGGAVPCAGFGSPAAAEHFVGKAPTSS